MKKEKVIPFVSVIIGLAAAYILFVNLDLEPYFRGKGEPVTMEDIKKDPGTDFAGSVPGEDVPRLSGKEEFETGGSVVYTAEPVDIIFTGAYELKPWVKPYTQRRTRKGRAYGAPKRKPKYLQYDNPDGFFQNHEDYLPFYLLKLPDGTYILAQIPKRDADAIQKGKHVTLPIGRRALKGIPETLRAKCEEYQAPVSGVYYAFCDTWYEENYTWMFLLRAGIAAAVCLAVSVFLITVLNRIFHT